MEGLYLHNPELRQRALLLKRKLTELINEPDEDHNILLLSRLGPYPQLLNLMGYKPNISYRQVTNEKINYLRTQISSCDEIIEKNTKEIYQELINQEYSNNLPNIADFELLYKEKISKLKETGFKTLHNAHPTRSWLFNRKFNKTCDDNPNCPTC